MEVSDDELSKWRLMADDLLVLEGGDREDVGRTAIFNGELQNCVHQNHIFRVRVNTSIVLPLFTMVYLNNPQVKMKFFQFAKATTGINSINKTQLRSLKLYCPPIQLQERFVKIANMFEVIKQKQNHSKQRIRQLINSLTHKLLNGEIDPEKIQNINVDYELPEKKCRDPQSCLDSFT